MEKDVINKLKYLINKKKDLQTICEELELKDYEVIGLVELLKENGELVDYVNGQIIKLKKPVQTNEVYELPNNLEHLKLLLISDTHLCNKSDRLDILKYLYEKADNKDIKHILHCGDLLDGIYTNRPQQLYELKAYGFDEHLDYVVNKYPEFDGKTYFIGGNHQNTYIRNNGADIGKAISKEREDMIYLAPDTADLKIGKLKIHMHHGGGGKAYSLSYKLQRYAETLTDVKPNIVMQGHFHNSMYMNYLDMNCFQVGALVDETPFSRQMGFKNEKSVWWLDVYFDNKGNVYSIEPKLETFGNKKIHVRK